MRIVLIGAGNLATHLGKALVAIGHEVAQVYSRTMQSASALASLVGADPVDDLSEVIGDGDVYMFSVKDSVLENLVATLCGRLNSLENKVFLHTAGSMPMDVFLGKASHYGVIYPMQTFSKLRSVNFREIPCFVEANDDFAMCQIEGIARQLSDKVYHLSSSGRKYLHLSAVFACNFVNHCYALAEKVLRDHGIPFDVMQPLIDETAGKIRSMSPKEAQTGPAVRYDENVIAKQVALLKDDAVVREIYELMSKSIHELALPSDSLLNSRKL